MTARIVMVQGGIGPIMNYKKLLVIFIISTSLIFSSVPLNNAYASTTFSIEDVNISKSAANSVAPEIVVVGSNVYIIWQDGADIFFDRSTDGGTTFVGPVNISGSGIVTSIENHHISVSGSNVYVMWREEVAAGINDIFVSSSTDSGANFGLPVNISNSVTDNSRDPQVASSGNNAYVLWREGSDILFSRSIDSGSTFDASFALDSSTTVRTPDIAADGTNVYAAFRNGGDVGFVSSTDSGATFSAPDVLGTDGSLDPKPRISASGTDVFVVWQQGVNVAYTKSSSSGATGTFSADISLGFTLTADHQITHSGTNVYVVWKNGADIAFRQSTDSGATFDAEINLSNTPDASSLPDVAAGSVFVVWREDTAGVGDDKDISLISSATDGSNFAGVQSVTSNGILASDPKVAVSGSDVYIVWSEATTSISGDGEIKFSKGAIASTSVSIDGPYKMTDTATITVSDSALNTDPAVQEMISVNVTSGIDPAGLLVTATENGINSDDFVASITFSTAASAGSTLQATAVPPQNTITATFGGVNSGSTIFPRSIALDSVSYDLGDIAFVTVTDQNSNLDAGTVDSISVDLTSQEAGDAEDVTLLETGVDTGVFGGNGLVEVIFSEGDNRYPTNAIVTVTVEDTLIPQNNMTIDSGWVNATSSSYPSGINVTITETGIATSTFTGDIFLSQGQSNDNIDKIHVMKGDFLQIVTQPPNFRLNALITPNQNESRELIDVLITDVLDETISASFGGVSDSATVGSVGGAPGGGGGGLIRPSLVFDILAGAGGGSAASAKPTIRSSSISFDTDPSFTQLEEGAEFGGTIREKVLDDSSDTQVVSVGKKIELKLDIHENRGFENLVHVSFYLLTPGEKPSMKDSTYIIYDKYDGMTINDPDGIFDTAAIDLLKNTATTGIVNISFSINKAVGMKDFFIQSWDEQKHSNEWTFDDAINVSGQSQKDLSDDLELPFTKTENPLNDKTETDLQDTLLLDTAEVKPAKSISPWIKTTAKWWTEKQVQDKEFIMAIEYLIAEEIILVEKQEIISSETEASIPPWFRIAADYWANGETPDSEFINGLEWLIKNEVIKV